RRRCTDGASQIPIAPAEPGAPHPSPPFPGGFRTPALVHAATFVAAGIRNPSQQRSSRDADDQTPSAFCVRQPKRLEVKFCCAAAGLAPISAANGTYWGTSTALPSMNDIATINDKVVTEDVATPDGCEEGDDLRDLLRP